MFASMDNNKITNDLYIYNVGIYVRLSREDENSKESESIQNQKDYLTNYVINKGWKLVDIYCDDGYTGTNFERPDFKRMINDIEKGVINLVITKDLSRLGRDYIETGYYLEKYFPEHMIKYIAVNDGIDTMSDNSNNDMNPFRSVINDMYSRDISRKVRTAKDTKRKNGKFIGAFAPYGYKKSPTDKNKLIIDEEAAEIVKRIFDLYLEGFGHSKIAFILNEECILTPTRYKAMRKSNYNNPKSKANLWSSETIRNILGNPTYCGCVAQNKYSIISYKVNKLIALSKDKWIIVDNTHEPIIDKSTFDSVQKMLERKNIIGYDKGKGKHKHLLSGLLFCGDCGAKLTYTNTRKGLTYCICSTYKRFKKCTRHSILESEIEENVLSDLKNISLYSVDQDNLYKVAQEQPQTPKSDRFKGEIRKTETRLQDIKKIIKSTYEDKIKGILTEQDFIELSKSYNSERDVLNAKLIQLKTKIKELNDYDDDNDKMINLVKEFTNFDNVDNVVLLKLIDKIEIYEDHKIVVHYKFKKPF